ncbi:group III truncated hemoglobin [Aureivirga sp. CE67]|uniref:group III truncated hemoglobin n=1 Tax=Aureivirga sp. CE67 TaxID=1788983 RepID=UPI0018CA5A7D|nr:group III truncated hemoglobin [Aureivirga sp. CE67]
MKKDIQNREDLYLIVSQFYKKLLNDAEMHHFFSEIVENDSLEEHLQVLVDFWDNILFYSNTYKKNAMQPHLEKNKQFPFERKHFQKWLDFFKQTVDENFEGENAHIIKNRATSIATVMEIKVSQIRDQKEKK